MADAGDDAAPGAGAGDSANKPVEFDELADNLTPPKSEGKKVEGIKTLNEGEKEDGEVGAAKLLDADQAIKGILSYATWSFTFPFFTAAITKGKGLGLGDVPRCPASDSPRLMAQKMKALLNKKDPVTAYLFFVYIYFRSALCYTGCTIAIMFF